jgi:hypothetical protein
MLVCRQFVVGAGRSGRIWRRVCYPGCCLIRPVPHRLAVSLKVGAARSMGPPFSRHPHGRRMRRIVASVLQTNRHLQHAGSRRASLSVPASGSWPSSAGYARAWPCSSSSGRSVAADGEDRSMAQTDQAWDWGVELRDEERSELELLRRTVAQLRTQLDQAHEALQSCRQRDQDASQALRQLAEAGPWRRRSARTALRERQLL